MIRFFKGFVQAAVQFEVFRVIIACARFKDAVIRHCFGSLGYIVKAAVLHRAKQSVAEGACIFDGRSVYLRAENIRFYLEYPVSRRTAGAAYPAYRYAGLFQRTEDHCVFKGDALNYGPVKPVSVRFKAYSQKRGS